MLAHLVADYWVDHDVVDGRLPLFRHVVRWADEDNGTWSIRVVQRTSPGRTLLAVLLSNDNLLRWKLGLGVERSGGNCSSGRGSCSILIRLCLDNGGGEGAADCGRLESSRRLERLGVAYLCASNLWAIGGERGGRLLLNGRIGGVGKAAGLAPEPDRSARYSAGRTYSS